MGRFSIKVSVVLYLLYKISFLDFLFVFSFHLRFLLHLFFCTYTDPSMLGGLNSSSILYSVHDLITFLGTASDNDDERRIVRVCSEHDILRTVLPHLFYCFLFSIAGRNEHKVLFVRHIVICRMTSLIA